MAITTDDFAKIWASTSPLTPYSFSESNYKEGWNFVGSTPPARQMWDYLQKYNDEKMQYLANNYLPLTGGTMTGDIALNGSEKWVKKSDNNGALGLAGGTTFGHGGSVSLFGKNHSTWGGSFWIVAHDGTNEKQLVGKPDGTLTWAGISLTDGTFLTVRTVNLAVETSKTGIIGTITAPAVSGYEFLCWFQHVSSGATFSCYPNAATSQTPNIYAIDPVSGKTVVNYALYIRKWTT